LLSDSTSAASCSDVEFIFARGSGQALNENKREAPEFKKIVGEIKEYAPTLTTNFYELGSSSHGGHKYPAVEANAPTAIGAAVRGTSSKYYASVREGIQELMAYFSEQKSCTNTRYVLAGYSQGAQVMGDALALIDRATIPAGLKDRVVYVALFGDPKL
jgi:hypothetical protein